MRRALHLIHLFIFIFGFVAAAAAADWADVYERTAPAVRFLDVGTDGGYCSGIVINKAEGFVLTAAHCVTDNDAFAVDHRDATVVSVNPLLELAVLKTRLRKGASQITLAPALPRVGSSVAVLGYPFGARTVTMQAGILANADAGDGTAWVNADMLPGDSGGAILNDAGELVGVTSGYRANGAAHIGRIVGIDDIRDFVEELLPAPAARK